MSRIIYTPPAPVSTSIDILSVKGTIPGGAFKTLSTAPVVILDNTQLVNKYIVPVAFTFLGGVNTVPMATPVDITVNFAVFPFARFTFRTGYTATTVYCMPLQTLAAGYDLENNFISVGTPQDIVLKTSINSPGADIFEMAYELLYIVRPIIP